MKLEGMINQVTKAVVVGFHSDSCEWECNWNRELSRKVYRNERNNKADRLIKGHFCTITKSLRKKDDSPHFIPLYNIIRVPKVSQYNTTDAWYKTVFHEMVHSTGVKERLNRKGLEYYYRTRKNIAHEELVAEIGSLCLCIICGIEPNIKNSTHYLIAWSQDYFKNSSAVCNRIEVANHLHKASQEALDAVEYILEQLGEAMEPVETTDQPTQTTLDF